MAFFVVQFARCTPPGSGDGLLPRGHGEGPPQPPLRGGSVRPGEATSPRRLSRGHFVCALPALNHHLPPPWQRRQLRGLQVGQSVPERRGPLPRRLPLRHGPLLYLHLDVGGGSGRDSYEHRVHQRQWHEHRQHLRQRHQQRQHRRSDPPGGLVSREDHLWFSRVDDGREGSRRERFLLCLA